MLQPVQLEHVSTRFPEEIAELRDFLGKAGVPVGTPEALASIAARLRDRGFHRDLMSYLWVAMDRHDGRVSSPELLGILAVAAAGERLAAAADESAAHDLLRFIMDARRTLAPSATPREPSVQVADVPVATQPAPVVDDRPAEVDSPPVLPPFVNRSVAFSPSPSDRLPEHDIADVTFSSYDDSDLPAGNGRKYALWIGTAIACILAGILLGLFLYRGHNANLADTAAGAPAHSATPAPAAPAAQAPQAEAEANPDATSTQSPDAAQEKSREAIPGSARHQRERRAEQTHVAEAHVPGLATQPAAPQPRVVYPMAPAAGKASPAPSKTSAPATASSSGAAPSPAPGLTASASSPVLVARNTHAPATSGPAAPIIRSAAAKPQQAIQPVGSDNLSKSLGWQAAPEDPQQRAENLHPRLRLRHHPGQPVDSYQDADTVSEASASSSPALPGTGGGAGTSAAGAPSVPAAPVPKGTVRSTSLGMMAGSEMFSPAPSYPVAAAMAHVQGEVKLQAAVDRDGNVAAARVISGPPQLRDAALDAVQRWRFRPFVSGGHATPVNTTVVMDFELQ